MGWWMFVTLAAEDRIACLRVDAASAALEPVGEVALGGRPAPLATDPWRRFLHVARRGDDVLTSFRLDRETGLGARLGDVALDSDPCFLATDRTGRWLFSAYYQAARLEVHRIGAEGAVSGPKAASIATGTGAHSLQTDASNRFAFAPHIAAGDGPNAIFQYRFDAATGHLAPNDPPRAEPGGPVGPRHLCFHPLLPLAYASNEQGSSVGVYRLDPERGTLDVVQTLSTLPSGASSDSKCSQIRITPCGRFLYAPNRGHDSIASFRVDPASGRLSPTGHAAAERVPRAVELTPDGRHLFAAGLETGRLTTYRIDPHDGGLEAVAVRDVGAEPMWVLVTPIAA